ncbi:DUF4294 domain-containing protein [Flavobacterium subsaxonicum]|uniref:DUF4294 domain-containing protein n=1 Tax=Flavobacterium subsaxonicum WB 4.1-42 = DSM 21790 TaxID=1121898 RepID=A0A0A2N443_9FLAO|nr:DUF4294 domain-containing protein [Flavobacterium subsaxonicum]KGO95175.1 hypothetical protein Q766_03510 [Flavobacterium subsaxonicum WB 4.1-42 = DSM 21790]
MKVTLCFAFFLLATLGIEAQVSVKDSIVQDSIAFSMQLQEIVISNVKDSLSDADKALLSALRRRTLKVYPYAKIAADRLTMLSVNMSKLKTDKEKKKYAKIVEKYLEDEFEAQLKKLSRKEGQILVKLIYRQTGTSTFDLIKEHKSGWKAFWSNRVAKVFNINLKTTYNPATVAEDYMIEGFLIKAFQEHKLQKQDPAFKIDYKALTHAWREKNKNKKQEG